MIQKSLDADADFRAERSGLASWYQLQLGNCWSQEVPCPQPAAQVWGIEPSCPTILLQKRWSAHHFAILQEFKGERKKKAGYCSHVNALRHCSVHTFNS